MLFLLLRRLILIFFFFFNATPTSLISTLSLHDALPICFFGCRRRLWRRCFLFRFFGATALARVVGHIPTFAFELEDRKSTRLNSSHLGISYAVFCLKKKIKVTM